MADWMRHIGRTAGVWRSPCASGATTLAVLMIAFMAVSPGYAQETAPPPPPGIEAGEAAGTEGGAGTSTGKASPETAEEEDGPPDMSGAALTGFWPTERSLPRPDLGNRDTIRFITETDYPPFHYLDASGVLVGFNIDLAWGICTALKVRCTIRQVGWNEMAAELAEGKADAAIASHRIDLDNRKRFHFTDRYYDTPARFVIRKDGKTEELTPALLGNKKVAVIKGTAHEAYLGAFFADALVEPFDSHAEAREALRTGKVDALFGDAITLGFWLAGEASRDCCRFSEGVYVEPRYFGNGVGIALRKDNFGLARILNFGLEQTRKTGLYSRLVRRHFPAALYKSGP